MAREGYLDRCKGHGKEVNMEDTDTHQMHCMKDEMHIGSSMMKRVHANFPVDVGALLPLDIVP